MIVIIGAGVIGSCTAHFLCKLGAKDVLVLDSCGIAPAASGKAGGFLAKDWCHGPLKKFASTSFDLHAQLAEELHGVEKYGYRRVSTVSLRYRASAPSSQQAGPHRAKADPATAAVSAVPAWVDADKVVSANAMGSTETTAQVHPRLFTEAVMESAVGMGAQFRVAHVVEVVCEGSGVGKRKVTGVRLEGGEVIAADVVVMAMGPWSFQACDWFKGLPRINGLKAHSITVRPPTPFTAHCVFLEQVGSTNDADSNPEIYCRPDGEVYICGVCENPDEVLVKADQVVPSVGACEELLKIGRDVSSALHGVEIERHQACHLPQGLGGKPIMGPIRSTDGAYIATGHTCWGILNSPATGLGMAELILQGQSKSVNLEPFFPEC